MTTDGLEPRSDSPPHVASLEACEAQVLFGQCLGYIA